MRFLARVVFRLGSPAQCPSGRAQAASSLTSCWSDPWDQALFCPGRGGVLRHRGSLPGASHCDPHRECGAGGAGTLPGVSGPGHLLQPSWTWDCPRQFLGSVSGAGGEGWLSRGCPGQSLLQSAVSCCKHRSGSLQTSIVQVGESAAQSLTSLASCLGAVFSGATAIVNTCSNQLDMGLPWAVPWFSWWSRWWRLAEQGLPWAVPVAVSN